MLLSIVVPCHNEQDALPAFYESVSSVARDMQLHHAGLEFEMVLVDDGSSDGTLAAMKNLQQREEFPGSLTWISFSRNFGKEAALYAGLEASKGDFVATMDADMQDPPSLLPDMYEILAEGEFDNVATRRVNRKGEPVIRSLFARMFYRIVNRISDTEIVDGARDYRLMKRSMVDAVLSMRECNRFSKGIFGWVGFKTHWMEFENVERVAGETSWSFWGLLVYSMDGIVGFSTLPLSMASVAGLALSVLAVVILLVIVVRAALFGDPVAGWPSTMSVILLIGGVQMLFLGVLGQYLAKTYLESKHRPLYIVRESSTDEG